MSSIILIEMIKTLPAMKCVDRVWCSLKKRFIMSDNYIMFYKNYRYLTRGLWILCCGNFNRMCYTNAVIYKENLYEISYS